MKLYRNKKLRRLIIPLLKKLNLGNITIRHHFARTKFRLDSFTHKGYWYHGKNREKIQMDNFRKLISDGDTVFELGAHIGYISVYFSQLVGEKGKVVVFEPGVNNLPYVRFNIDHAPFKNVQLVEKAVSDQNGIATFYLEHLTGQSNSLVKDYRVSQKIQSKAFVDLGKNEVQVETIRLDDFVKQHNITKLDFIKIDIEGAEYLAIKGMSEILANLKPVMMIEVTENHDALYNLLREKDYVFIDEYSKMVEEKKAFYGNLFCVHISNQVMIGKLLQEIK